jgi:hypothetical protein
MTTQTWTTALNHANTAGWRATHSELSTHLTTVGAPKSADTGQVDWTTNNIPTTAGTPRYEIRYLNDSLHATSPIYFKLEWDNETAGGTIPYMFLTVGTGSDGAGTLTGDVTARVAISIGELLSSNVTARASYLCGISGYLGLSYKRYAQHNGGSAPMGFSFFAISRFRDASGTPIDGGFYVYYSSGANHNVYRYTVNTTLNTVSDDGNAICFFPGAVGAPTLVGGEAQVMRHFGMQPTVTCVPDFLSYLSTEIGTTSTFTATPVGVTPITYLALGPDGSGNIAAPGIASVHASPYHMLAMRWE